MVFVGTIFDGFFGKMRSAIGRAVEARFVAANQVNGIDETIFAQRIGKIAHSYSTPLIACARKPLHNANHQNSHQKQNANNLPKFFHSVADLFSLQNYTKPPPPNIFGPVVQNC